MGARSFGDSDAPKLINLSDIEFNKEELGLFTKTQSKNIDSWSGYNQPNKVTHIFSLQKYKNNKIDTLKNKRKSSNSYKSYSVNTNIESTWLILSLGILWYSSQELCAN